MAGALSVFYLAESFICRGEKFTFKNLADKIYPFVPAFVLYASYLAVYLSEYGWFFSNKDFPWKEGWSAPESAAGMIKNIAAMGMWLLENGRFIIWLAALGSGLYLLRKGRGKEFRNDRIVPVLILILILGGIFFLFAASTRIITGSRYYMGIFVLLTMATYRFLTMIAPMFKIRLFTLLALLFMVTGHFWVYPEKIAVAWDTTLAHVPYYKLREQSLEFIRSESVKSSEVSGGFGFTGKQRYIDLKDPGIEIGHSENDPYFIYSNISNISDDLITEFNDPEKWAGIASFKKGRVFVSILRNRNYETGQ